MNFELFKSQLIRSLQDAGHSDAENPQFSDRRVDCPCCFNGCKEILNRAEEFIAPLPFLF